MLMVVAAVAGVLGLMFLTNAIYFFRKDRRERGAWASATGVVIEHQQRRPPRGRSVFTPIVKFTSERGAIVQFENAVGQWPPQHKVGQSVPVLYDPATPKSARIASGTSLSVAAPFFVAGLIGLLLAAGLLWWGR